MTAPKRPAKHTVTVTAHAELAVPGTVGARNGRELYHAVVDQDIHGSRHGIYRNEGEAICGERGPWPEMPLALFPPFVTCALCVVLAQRHAITITGQPDTIPAGRP